LLESGDEQNPNLVQKFTYLYTQSFSM